MSQHETDRRVSLRTLLTISLRDYAGLSERYATLLAFDTGRGLSALRGGEMIYVPKPAAELRGAVRDELVRARFNGVNLAEVCAEFELSRATVYKIIAEK